MRSLALTLALPLLAACASSTSSEPSLAPRAAEAIDPRLPVPSMIDQRPADPALASRLRELVGVAQANVAPFDAREAEASRLAAEAGPIASESWVAAQQALSRLVEQYGVTTQAAADIDRLAAEPIETQRWLTPGAQAAIAAAAGEVAAISERQSAAIARLTSQLER